MRKRDLRSIAEKIYRFYYSRKYMPSYSEMLRILGYNSKNSVFKVVAKLLKHGYLVKKTSRHLLPAMSLGDVRMLGHVTAGFPSPAEEELLDTISLNEFLIQNPQSTFLLKVDGDSMKDAGIIPGDLVLVEKGRQPRNGDIVIAQVDEEWTIKYFYKKAGKVFLKPGNKKYSVVQPRRELTIAGVVTANVRKYH